MTGTLLLALLLSACGGGSGVEPTPVPTPAPGPLWSEVAPLRDAAAQTGRMIGAAVFSSRLGSDASYTGAAGRHFNSLTAEYEMKWDPIQRSPGVFDFSGGDAIVRFAEVHVTSVRRHLVDILTPQQFAALGEAMQAIRDAYAADPTTPDEAG